MGLDNLTGVTADDMDKVDFKCIGFVSDGSGYPLCDNIKCKYIEVCNLSSHMKEDGYFDR